MFPQAFQFNEKYLIAILEHTYSCQYGTFIGNCDKQRQNLKLSERTYSLWGYLVTHNDEFVNPLYEKSTYAEILKPNLSPQNIKFWRGLYCKFETGAHPREPIVDLLTITQVKLFSFNYRLNRRGRPNYLVWNSRKFQLTWTERFFDPRTIPHHWRITAVICQVRYKRLAQKSASLEVLQGCLNHLLPLHRLLSRVQILRS